MQGYKFNNNHTLNIEQYDWAAPPANMEEGGFNAPDPEPFRERRNTMSWLGDLCQRDQFAIRPGKEMAV